MYPYYLYSVVLGVATVNKRALTHSLVSIVHASWVTDLSRQPQTLREAQGKIHLNIEQVRETEIKGRLQKKSSYLVTSSQLPSGCFESLFLKILIWKGFATPMPSITLLPDGDLIPGSQHSFQTGKYLNNTTILDFNVPSKHWFKPMNQNCR